MTYRGLGQRNMNKPVGHCATTGKAQFTSRSSAKTTARHHGTQGEVRPYKCNHCGYWHLGHTYGQDRHWHRQVHGREES
jgi:hypothetical protein